MLRVEDLHKKISNGKTSFLLDEISFHLPKGYICGLIGENGAGKTSLIKTLSGLYGLDSGRIYIDGMNLQDEEAKIKDELGIVLNECLFDKTMTLEEIGIYYGEMYSRFDMGRFMEYLTAFKLNKKQKLKTLSKGMEIKLQLAFALSHDARLFLLDEPTAGLDKGFRDDFLKICTDLVSDGERSVLISTHLTEDMDRIADYIGYIQDGKLLFFNTKGTVCDRFYIVNGEAYKIKLLPKEAVVYLEENKYSATAMVIDKKRFPIQDGLEKHRPNIGEFMYYFVKGGNRNAEDIAKRYLEIDS